MIELSSCPVCHSSGLKTKKSYHFKSPFTNPDFREETNTDYQKNRLAILFGHMLKNKDELNLNIAQCQSCSFLFLNPRFTEEEIISKYSRIAELEGADSERANQSTINAKQLKRAKRVFDLITQYEYGKSVLDYGGGKGYNLSYFKEDECTVYLIDYVKYNLVEGVNYLGKDFKNLSPDQKFDIILFCHTLEHVVDPIKTLKKLISRLNKNGLLYIEVPLGCWREWNVLIEPITHLNFFSEESLHKLCRILGLEVVHLSTDMQWLSNSNNYCINMVARLSKNEGLKSYKSSLKQETALHYYFKFILLNPSRILRILNRIKDYILSPIKSKG